MTLDSTHSSLLKGIALHLKEKARIAAYSDYLQELGSPAWMIVKHYDPTIWPVWTAPYRRHKAWDYRYVEKGEREWRWSIPWLEGEFRSEKYTDRADLVVRWTLLAYAEGRVVQ